MASISDTIITGGAKSFAEALDQLGVKYQLYDNPGISSSKDRDWIGSPTRGAQVPVWDGQTFKLMKGNDLLYQGSGIDGLRQAATMSGDLGKGWRIISSAPDGTDEASTNALFDKDGSGGLDYGGQRRSDFGDFLPYALLAALPFGAAAALGGLGAAAGGGSIGGGAAGAAGAAGSAAGAGAAGIGGSVANAAGLAAGGLAAPITVVGPTAAGLGAATAAGLGAGAAGLGVGLGASGSSGSLPSDIVVNGMLPTGIDFGGLSAATALGGAGAAGLGVGGAATPPPEVVDPNTITVQGAQPQNLTLTGAMPGITAAELALAAGAPLPSTGAVAQPAPTKGTIDKVIDGLRAAGLATGLIGNLFGGGGGSSGNGKVPGGLNGDLDPIFNAELPTNPVIPGVGTADKLGTRTMSPQDWYRYGERPEQSFFNYVPQGYTPPAPGVSDPQWDSLAVKGG